MIVVTLHLDTLAGIADFLPLRRLNLESHDMVDYEDADLANAATIKVLLQLQ